jgi:hypothetical protein
MKIAFGYKAGSGKDLSVKYLIKKYGGNKISFSQPLYDILFYAQKVCGFELKKDRKFLQFIGTEWARSINPNIWIDLLITNSNKLNNQNIYCSDVRFVNEFESLKKNGWILIKILRPNIDSKRIGNGEHTHVSEIELDTFKDDKWDYIIENNGTIKELYNKLDNIIDDISLKKEKNVLV